MPIKPPERIDRFDGPWRFLSNFYAGEVIYNGVSYHTAEHAFQAAKATNSTDAEFVRSAKGPAEAKRRGRLIKCRPDWEDDRDGRPVKVHVMLDVERARYAAEPMRSLLLATESAYLEEGNWWGDRYWGTVNGVGENWQGRLLMQVRGELAGVGLPCLEYEWGCAKYGSDRARWCANCQRRGELVEGGSDGASDTSGNGS